MIKLYKSDKYFKNNEVIIDNESFFLNIPFKSMHEESIKVMQKIDKAILLDINTGAIKTPFGITSIKNLSTGYKTVLNLIYLTENPKEFPNVKAIVVNECGWNALEELFNIIENYNIDIGIILEHDNKLYKCSNREYLVNGKETIQELCLYGCIDE